MQLAGGEVVGIGDGEGERVTLDYLVVWSISDLLPAPVDGARSKREPRDCQATAAEASSHRLRISLAESARLQSVCKRHPRKQETPAFAGAP